MSELTGGVMNIIGSGILTRATPEIADISVFNGSAKEIYLIRYTIGSGVTSKVKFTGINI